MAVPRILFAAPLLVAGIVVPAVVVPAAAPAGTVGMVHEAFAKDTVTVQCGHTLTLVNSSRFVHIIGAGRDGTLAEAAAGVPVPGRRLMETNSRYVTGRWEKPGTYYLTCSVHPEMTLKVVVTAGCCC